MNLRTCGTGGNRPIWTTNHPAKRCSRFDAYLSYHRIPLQQTERGNFCFLCKINGSDLHLQSKFLTHVTCCNMRASRFSPTSRSSCSSSERGESKQLNGMGAVVVCEYRVCLFVQLLTRLLHVIGL